MLTLHFTAYNHAVVATSMCHLNFIKTENITIDQIGRIICYHLLARAYSYFLYKISMHT